MKSFARSDRVSGEIQKIISEILQKHIKDPRLEMVTISTVKMSKDLRNAKVYFTMRESGFTRENVMEGFGSASGFIKRTLSSQLDLRYMPNIKFYYDESFDYGDHIDKVLKAIATTDGSSHNQSE